MWLRRKLPGEALPIVPKPAGEKVKGAGGITSPRQQQVSYREHLLYVETHPVYVERIL